jgi:ribosomal protein S18 acetylase RimI-like enzyme
MIDTIEIKRVYPDDIDELQNISRNTFTETFSTEDNGENMAKYVAECFSLEKLTAELNNKDSTFYFAMLDQKAIGYLKLNTGNAQTELNDVNALEIERIYVSQEYLGKKVGQVLYEKAIEISHKLGMQYVWLGVWEENPRAITFYAKNGFIAFDTHIFRFGNEEQTDIMMKKMLRAEG